MNQPTLSHLLPYALNDLLAFTAEQMTRAASRAYRLEPRRSPRAGGKTLRPGRDTPLWNELRRQLSPHLRQYGHQAKLGRLLGLPRQRINAFVTGGGEMPDAERTLQLLAWLIAVHRGRRPG